MDNEIRKVQLTAVEAIGQECQRIVARHDDLLFKIKALTVTLWSASTGWALTKNQPDLLIVGLVAVGGLWFVAATFRGAQKRYIQRSDGVYSFLTNAMSVTEFIASGELPLSVPRSLGGYENRKERARLLIKGLISPTVSAFYGLLIVISAGLYFYLS